MRRLQPARGQQRARSIKGEAGDSLAVDAPQHGQRVTRPRVPDKRRARRRRRTLPGGGEQPVGVDGHAQHLGRVGHAEALGARLGVEHYPHTRRGEDGLAPGCPVRVASRVVAAEPVHPLERQAVRRRRQRVQRRRPAGWRMQLAPEGRHPARHRRHPPGCLVGRSSRPRPCGQQGRVDLARELSLNLGVELSLLQRRRRRTNRVARAGRTRAPVRPLQHAAVLADGQERGVVARPAQPDGAIGVRSVDQPRRGQVRRARVRVE
mmetsp:Transcript_8555/g.28182  ORF Transcript_8555/g.28182 Transcript_8555/m.28182 type:complete len:264 (+) Transcript_8555:507-1298(+)